LHTNGLIQKRSRVPGWHPSDYWPRCKGHENGNKSCKPS